MKLLQSKRRRNPYFCHRPCCVVHGEAWGGDRLKSRVVNSMSMALGRQTEVSAITFHLLPRPGFDLENLVVHDDPTISAEPMLRASEVSAALRLTSLLRGRLEISRLDLTEPSLNLARTVDGRWNLEGLVERAAKRARRAHIKNCHRKTPWVPVYQANRARINIKLGQEKKAFALTDTDPSLAGKSRRTHGECACARSQYALDFNLTDTGLLRVNGTWRRAEQLKGNASGFQPQLAGCTAWCPDQNWYSPATADGAEVLMFQPS